MNKHIKSKSINYCKLISKKFCITVYKKKSLTQLFLLLLSCFRASTPVIYKIFINYLPTGNKTRLPVKSSDTIPQLKTKIGESLGFLPEDQVLQILGTGILRNGNTVADYYIKNNTEIALTVKTNTSMGITIMTSVNETYHMEVYPTTTIADLKRMYSNMSGNSRKMQRLFFHERKLKDPRMLQDYKIRNGSTVFIIRELKFTKYT